MKPADVAAKVVRAESRIRPYIRETILEYSPYLSRFGHASVYCKLENLQHTGSFKLRGAMNKLLSLSKIERRRGVVTIKADVTNRDSLAARWLRVEIRGAPPLTLVYPPAEGEPLRLVGGFSKADLREALNAAGGAPPTGDRDRTGTPP